VDKTIINVNNIDRKLWLKMREVAIRRQIVVGQALNEAMKEYIERIEQEKEQ
jgi:hypothetical protein